MTIYTFKEQCVYLFALVQSLDFEGCQFIKTPQTNHFGLLINRTKILSLRFTAMMGMNVSALVSYYCACIIVM